MFLYVQDPYVVAESVKRLLLFQSHEQWTYLRFCKIGDTVSERRINHRVKQRELCPSSIPQSNQNSDTTAPIVVNATINDIKQQLHAQMDGEIMAAQNNDTFGVLMGLE
jgi:hypothetical protein